MVQELKLLGVSERMACRVVGMARSGFRYPLQPSSSEEGELRGAVRRLARQRRRYGYRRITALLRRQGHRVNAKRVWRIWKSEGLSLPRKRPRLRRQGPSLGLPPRALKPNHIWIYDILFDRTKAGQILKILIVLDEYTRESLAIRVERHLGAGKVIETLEWLLMQRGAPEYLRSDNGPEFIAQALHAWLAAAAKETRTVYIEPGHPWENGYVESFIGKLRDECPNEEVFRSIKEARVVIESWRREYNQRRPHSALEYQTLAERALSSGSDSLPVVSMGTQGTPETIQGHRLNCYLDRF